jgi:GGDEF domain-containing protein
MNKKLITGYGIGAFAVIIAAIVLFSVSIVSEVGKGTSDAERSFNGILQMTSDTAIQSGFMSDQFIASMTDTCRATPMLSALVISTSSGFVFAWPEQSGTIQYDAQGKARITDSSLFSKAFSANLDVGNGTAGSVVITAVVRVLPANAIFSASRVSFFIILSLLLITVILLVFSPSSGKPAKKEASAKGDREELNIRETDDSAISFDEIRSDEEEFADAEIPFDSDVIPHFEATDSAERDETNSAVCVEEASEPEAKYTKEESSGGVPSPAGLFSPVTGIGWEQYLPERLDAELVRAASSEQDLALIVIRISGLLHTDLVSRKITDALVDVVRFKDMLFEFGQNGFAGILQNTNLDQAMKEADDIYAKIDSLFMDTGFNGQMTIGITTRTARLLPASRMIEEAVSAAKKALEEPSLPIVAFRANPEKYRDFVAEQK